MARRRRSRPPTPPGANSNPNRAVQGATPPTQAVAFRQTSQSITFEGPLPPPALLAQYDEILPGLAGRIVSMAEAQSSHRMGLEQQVIHADISRARWGLIAGFTVAVLFLAASVVLIGTGHAVPGMVLGTVDIVGLAGVFIHGTRSRRQDLDRKRRATR